MVDLYRVRRIANSGITLLARRSRLGPYMRLLPRYREWRDRMINSYEEFLDTTLELVKATEDNHEYALSAVTTIARLIDRGYDALAFEVLETFRPGA